MSLAPILLFVYKRKSHVIQTIEALKKNNLAKESQLIIYSDGPKSVQDRQSVKDVRGYINQVKGFKSLNIIERKINLGLAQNLIQGISEQIDYFGKAIVLEDDIVTSPVFLEFMNKALDIYSKSDEVMHISGYNYPVAIENQKETFFFRAPTCWGWATWKESWDQLETDIESIFPFFDKYLKVYEFDYKGSAGMYKQLVDNFENRLNTWAIFWYYTIFKKNGLCLHPSGSLSKNIGHDGTGENCKSDADFINQIPSEFNISYFEQNYSECTVNADLIIDYHRGKNPRIKRIARNLYSFYKFLKYRRI